MESAQLMKLHRQVAGGSIVAMLNRTNITKGPSGFYGGERIALADTTTTTITEDIPTIVSQKILETAVAKQVVRKLFPTDGTLVNSPGVTLQFPNLNTITFGAAGTEGSITLSDTAVDTGPGVTATPVWYMGGVKLTYQALTAGVHNVETLSNARLGIDAAVFEDKLALGTFYNGATAAHKEDKSATGWDATSGWQTNVTDDINGSIENVQVDKYNPTHIIFNTALAKYIRKHDDFISAYKYGAGSMHTAGATELKEAGIIGAMWGMQVVVTPNMYESTSYSNTDTFMVADTDFAAVMVDKVPFTIEQKPFPENLERWLIAYFATVPTVVQPNALSGKTDCINPS